MSKLTIEGIPAQELPAYIEKLNRETHAWTMQAARGETGWICADCCCSDPQGMPDECFHGQAHCTSIIQRDKREAMSEGAEPQ